MLVKELLRSRALSLADGEGEAVEREELEDRLLEEIVGAAGMFGDGARGAVQQGERNAVAQEADAQDFAQSLAYGWPTVHDEPTLPRAPGRFAKSFPLKFPMGIADLHDDRPIQVSVAEYVQLPIGLPGRGLHMAIVWLGPW